MINEMKAVEYEKKNQFQSQLKLFSDIFMKVLDCLEQQKRENVKKKYSV